MKNGLNNLKRNKTNKQNFFCPKKNRKFVLHADWNSWDDYTADQIEWLDDATGTYGEECEIMEKYEEQMNG